MSCSVLKYTRLLVSETIVVADAEDCCYLFMRLKAQSFCFVVGVPIVE
jgi:hypothetical protein